MKYFAFLFSVSFILSCAGRKQQHNIAENRQETVAPYCKTLLAALPDSLRPKRISLDSMPRPTRVFIPLHNGGYYSVANARGEVRQIKLESPIKKMLPILTDAKGEPIKDSSGKTFVMGNGGLSSFTTFTTDDGLADDVVFYSKMDRAGNLWFCTLGGGVSRYDGKSFTNFTTAHGLGDNTVWNMLEDRAGNIWFGTAGGASRYDGRTFTNFTTTHGLAGNQVSGIAEDLQGKLWFATYGGGVSCYNPAPPGRSGSKLFTTLSTAQGLADNRVHDIAVDKKGCLWFGTDGSGVSRYDGRDFTNFTRAQGLANNTVFSITSDRKGNIWFGTDGGGVSCYNGKSFTTYTTTAGLASNHIVRIAEDRTGNIWFGAFGGGVSRYDGRSFTSFSTAQGLASNRVLSIAQDKAGNLWFGTDGAGVSRYDGRSFTSFTSAQGLANNVVLSIAEDNNGNFWFGTNAGGGLSRYDGRSFTTFTTAQGLAGNTVLSIAKDGAGNLWFGTVGGVSRFDGRSFTSFTSAQGMPGNIVIGIAEDRKGNLWFGTDDGGVCRYDGKSFISFGTAQGFGEKSVWSILEDRTGNMWFGTRGGGLSRYDGRSIITFTTANGLPDNTITSMTEDKKGNLWFGTYNGLSILSVSEVRNLNLAADGSPDEIWNTSPGGTPAGKLFRTFTKADGLPDSIVTQVLQLPDGRMATGTSAGIAIFMPSPDLSRLNNLEVYNSNTGYPIKDVNGGQRSMYLDSKGFIWAGTASGRTGLVRFDLAALYKTRDTPSVVIKSIRLNDEHICWYDLRPSPHASTPDSTVTPANVIEEISTTGSVLTPLQRDTLQRRFSGIMFDSITPFYSLPQHLELPYQFNHITIDFNAIETGKPNLVSYRYMLEGYDKDWSAASTNTSATFGNINEGSYVFRVKALGPNGVWGQPVAYPFRVLPPWYRTWWAYIIYALSFLAFLRIFSRWRERKLRSENERLETTVALRTAEVVSEKKRSDDLLRNILPEEVAEELKVKGATTARYFENVTVLFTDFVNFTSAGERMSPQELVDELHTCFRTFDEIAGRYNIEKIKTVGDAYLAVAGLPMADAGHAEKAVKAGLEIAQFMSMRWQELGDRTFNVRVGIHSGSVVAGIVGVKKFAYDIWGDAVNTAARMEQNSLAGKVNISEATYELVREQFNCTYRGEIAAKNKGAMKMYFVERTVHEVV